MEGQGRPPKLKLASPRTIFLARALPACMQELACNPDRVLSVHFILTRSMYPVSECMPDLPPIGGLLYPDSRLSFLRTL